MRRGEIYVVDLEPAQPGEADKARPCVIVSNNHRNTVTATRRRGTVTVVPLTTNVTRVYPFNVLVPAGSAGLRADSKAQTEQLRAVAYGRVRSRVGRLDPALLERLDDALRMHLQL